MSRAIGPGPRSMDVLAWISRIGVSPPEAVQAALGMSRPTAWSHARRLVLQGWLERVPTMSRHTSLLVVTEAGYRRLGYERRMREVRVRPHQWEHVVACADVAAWLSVNPKVRWWRGEREFGDHPERSWTISYPATGTGPDGRPLTKTHRPDLVAMYDGKVTAIEVELSVKSKARLGQILTAYGLAFALTDLEQTIYVTGSASVDAAIEKARDNARLRTPQVDAVLTEEKFRLETIRALLPHVKAPEGHKGTGGHPEAEPKIGVAIQPASR